MSLPRLLRDERGVSALEFALILPLLVLLSVGTIDVSRLVLITQKVQSAAFTLADLTARISTAKSTTLGNEFLAINQVMKPFDFDGEGNAIISIVSSPTAANTPLVALQCKGSGGYAATSSIGVVSHTATLPSGFDIGKGETVVAAEVYFDFEPLFGIGLLSSRVIRRAAFFKPRLGELDSLTCAST
ncbi:MAG: TadE/TadG family type IV pilus assembly protein [Amaricoccus sp.]|uniref:TadE/TadG family type IV pilus assembly protein n=1 Tax=Amaricoccus sp. TaxID=1872485 RepID=UPI0039E46CAF